MSYYWFNRQELLQKAKAKAKKKKKKKKRKKDNGGKEKAAKYY